MTERSEQRAVGIRTQVDFFLSPFVTNPKKEHATLVDTTMSVSRTLAEELKLDPDGDQTGSLSILPKRSPASRADRLALAYSGRP